jgi:hypothetical protein
MQCRLGLSVPDVAVEFAAAEHSCANGSAVDRPFGFRLGEFLHYSLPER